MMALSQKKNFPWKITKKTNKEGTILFIINDRDGDVSEISVNLENNADFNIYHAWAGIAIEFFCQDEEIPNFKIEIR